MTRDEQLIYEGYKDILEFSLERDTPHQGAGFIASRAGGALKELIDTLDVGNRMGTEEAVLGTQIKATFSSNNPDVQNAVIDLLKAASNHSNPDRKYVASTILTFITDQKDEDAEKVATEPYLNNANDEEMLTQYKQSWRAAGGGYGKGYMQQD